MSLSRRDVLRGLGSLVALPTLTSCLGARAADPAPPKRFLAWVSPNGHYKSTFFPTGGATGFTLPTVTAPLEPLRDRILFLSGLRSNVLDLGGDPHALSVGGLLTGRPLSSGEGVAVENSVSLDQVIAAQIGTTTRLRSLELGSEPSPVCELLPAERADTAGCLFQWNLAWDEQSHPLPKLVNPRAVFERLFGSVGGADDARATARRLRERRSVLDSVLTDVGGVRRRASAVDRDRLDAYLTRLREVEAALDVEVPAACGDAAAVLGSALESVTTIDLATHVRFMRELMVLALSCDQTRVVTYLLGNSASNQPHPSIGVYESHHVLAHHDGVQDRIDKLIQVERWQIEQFAALLQALMEVPESDGAPLLDHCAVLYGSDMGDGNAHTFDDMPFLVAGGCQGTIAVGRHLAFDDAPLHADLLVALLRAFDVPRWRFGEGSTGPLPGVLA